jgi:hypothetical protein
MKNKTWLIKRYVLEEYEVEAVNRKEALYKIGMKGDPGRVTILKETASIIKY